MLFPLKMTVTPKWFRARGQAVAAVFLTLSLPLLLQRRRVGESLMLCVSPTATRRLKPLRLPPRGALRAVAPTALLPLRRTTASGWMRAGLCLLLLRSFTVLWQPLPRLSLIGDPSFILRIPSSQNFKCAGASALYDVLLYMLFGAFRYSCIHVSMYSCIHVFILFLY